MAETKSYTTLIKRTGIGVLQEYCRMKNVKISNILHNNHGELKKYESQFGRELTKMDAIVISPLTQSEVTEIIDGYYENEDLQTYQREQNKERLKCHEENFGEPA